MRSYGISIACPYCNRSRNFVVENDGGIVRGQEVALCGGDSGCDKYFAVFWHIDLRADTKKIEGQR